MAKLPELPASHASFIPYLKHDPKGSLASLVKPYNDYEAKLREVFAQSRDDPIVQNPNVNLVPVFDGHERDIRMRARPLDDPLVNEKYIMTLDEKNRKLDGSRAMVPDLSSFKENFNVFSESSLNDLDWSNVVVAGSAVVTALLPVPDEHIESKRALRKYYHDELAPSSDVDLFIWGLDEQAAIEKIKQIERCVRDSILSETTTIRTRNAITIASQYPTRHVQIVLRLYKSVSEILTGFDVDCSCFAYDGKQVYGTPRGITAFMSQCNTIDLSRRSPSYESRLSKYARRGFEVLWPNLERQRIDPTIFERSFSRVQGLAKLLVLEKLPKESDREAYLNQRRSERGRPTLNSLARQRNNRKLRDNFKDKDPEDVAEWDFEEDVSNYHSFAVPYGPRYTAKKIERLLFTKDLLLNAEWNVKPDRNVHLHRHPCFIGDAEYVVNDCCTACPEPTTDEEKEIAAEEDKIYVSGKLAFMKEDPGRQAIGSFHPLTSEDWTDQAYIGNTQALCQAIVEGDVDYVRKWIQTPNIDVNRRDHTGRTPLHLACQVASPDTVRCLVEGGARIVARLTDGITALHIACLRGNAAIVQILLEKSEANEEAEAEKEDRKKKAHNTVSSTSETAKDEAHEECSVSTDSEDDEMVDSTDDASDSLTQGSFVKIKSGKADEEDAMDGEGDEPDIYDVNVLAWDSPVSPLHLCILKGQVNLVSLLISKFGADVLLPVKPINNYTRKPQGAIMSLVLAAHQPDLSVETTKALLELGASSAQADTDGHTALEYVVASGNIEAVKAMLEHDPAKAQAAIKHLTSDGYWNSKYSSPLQCAIAAGDSKMAIEMLNQGANPEVSFGDFAAAYISGNRRLHAKNSWAPPVNNNKIKKRYQDVEQPLIQATSKGLIVVAERILSSGISINTLTNDGLAALTSKDGAHSKKGKSLLDLVDERLSRLEDDLEPLSIPDPPKLDENEAYHGMPEHSYLHFHTKRTIERIKAVVSQWPLKKDEALKKDAKDEKKAAMRQKKTEEKMALEQFRNHIKAQGAKRFRDLYPDIKEPSENPPRKHLKAADKDEDGFDLKLSFDVPELDENLRQRYIQLFEAAWAGDLQAIKNSTTKAAAGDAPLKVAVKDNHGFSPFSLAVARGHLDLADVILQIAQAQFKPDDESARRRRYFIESENPSEGDYLEENHAHMDSDRVPVSSELVDDQFTIDDIANLHNLAESKIPSWKLLVYRSSFCMLENLPRNEARLQHGLSQGHWNMQTHTALSTGAHLKQGLLEENYPTTSLMDYAIRKQGLPLVEKLLGWAKEHGLPGLTNPVAESPSELLWSDNDFFLALEQGRTDVAGALITSTGIGIPYEDLAKESGIKDHRKPKYYEGLLLRGKHRSDWAREALQSPGRSRDPLKTSPLLKAIHRGSRQSVEWLLSDAPSRLLRKFLEENAQEDSLLKLAESQAQIDDMINGWLNSRRNLALHVAVLHNDRYTKYVKKQREYSDFLKYLIGVFPDSLETKSASGHTPLSLAFSEHKIQAAEILIAANANQAVRDNLGRNILHLSLQAMNGTTHTDSKELNRLLGMIDRNLIVELSHEHCVQNPSSLSPLARYLRKPHSYANSRWDAKTSDEFIIRDSFETLIKYTGKECLKQMDGSGQLPLHVCVINSYESTLRSMLETLPELVCWENAMGQTALELAITLYIRQKTSSVPSVDRRSEHDEVEYRILKLLEHKKHEMVGKNRVLVSVKQASEVARRLSEAQDPVDWDVRQRRRRMLYGGGLKRSDRVSNLTLDEIDKFMGGW